MKIAQVRARGSLQGRAVNNYIEFFDWCEKMECHVGILSQAAALIFGGSHNVDSLIKVTRKKSILDACWGAAWDAWYCWMVQNLLRVIKVDGILSHAIFVTHDAASAVVASQCLPRAIFARRGEPFLSASEVRLDAPYYAGKEQRLMHEIQKRKSFDVTRRRIMRNIDWVPNEHKLRQERVEVEILALEKELY